MANAQRDTSATSERSQALAGLQEFRQEAATLRAALRRFERAMERACRQVEREVPVHEIMGQIGVGELRADLADRGAQHRCHRTTLGHLPAARVETGQRDGDRSRPRCAPDRTRHTPPRLKSMITTRPASKRESR